MTPTGYTHINSDAYMHICNITALLTAVCTSCLSGGLDLTG